VGATRSEVDVTAYQSSEKSVPAVAGENSAGGVGVSGVSADGRAVEGRSVKGVGIVGISTDYRGIEGHSTNEHAILGKSTKGSGVAGISVDNRGVIGRSDNEHGVFGESAKGAGVVGVSAAYRGVSGRSTTGHGVWGISNSGTGVTGVCEAGNGRGVYGKSKDGPGMWGVSETHEGVHAETSSVSTAAVAAYQMNTASTTAALFAKHHGNGTAARFEGDVEVTGDLRLLGADVAEQFDLAADVPAGGVVVLDDSARIDVCRAPYDRRVAGIVSGLGDRKPAVVLDRSNTGRRLPVAVLGKAWCLADASDRPIGVGDLLTTSATAGHAMLAAEPSRAFGAVIGKALTPLATGRGTVLVLVGLG
jgi:hypothetical protein